MNAAITLIGLLSRPTVLRLDGDRTDDHQLDRLGARFAGDLISLLNRLRHDELRDLAIRLRLAADPPRDIGAVRRLLWRWGAVAEAGGDHWLGSALQPTPQQIGSRLAVSVVPRGLAPAAPLWPRPVPPARAAEVPEEEPDDVDALLAAADRALGVRMPARGRDKGAWGRAAATLLGVIERGQHEPDWRGEVEIKTVPIARDRSGFWRVTEDPAIAMADASPLSKLRRVLWLCRSAVGDGATLVSWYLVDWDADVARWVRRDLHTRPKGPRGTDARGWYLHKRFFLDVGLYATLNGPAPIGNVP